MWWRIFARLIFLVADWDLAVWHLAWECPSWRFGSEAGSVSLLWAVVFETSLVRAVIFAFSFRAWRGSGWTEFGPIYATRWLRADLDAELCSGSRRIWLLSWIVLEAILVSCVWALRVMQVHCCFGFSELDVDVLLDPRMSGLLNRILAWSHTKSSTFLGFAFQPFINALISCYRGEWKVGTHSSSFITSWKCVKLLFILWVQEFESADDVALCLEFSDLAGHCNSYAWYFLHHSSIQAIPGTWLKLS